MRFRSSFAFALFVTACGGAPPAKVATPSPPPAAPVAAPVPSASDAVRRKDVVAFVDLGFGRFLQRVAVEPSLDSGRFRGWTILELRPADFWQSVDLKPGDVVTSVNGLPLEHEVDAWEAFESLRTADEIRVTYQRGNAARSVRYRIVD